MTPTLEQIKEILAGAPDGATHVDIEGDYWVMQETQTQLWCDNFEWCCTEPQESTHNLSDLRTILDQAEEIEQLQARVVMLESVREEAKAYTVELEDKIKALESERDALVAHVERLIEVGTTLTDPHELACYEVKLWDEVCEQSPTANLAERDAEVARKAIESFKDELVSSVSVAFKPHIEGVCAVIQERVKRGEP